MEASGGDSTSKLIWTQEVITPIWTLEAFIKAQLAARAFPDKFALMGGRQP
jgi:hypothetical protein